MKRLLMRLRCGRGGRCSCWCCRSTRAGRLHPDSGNLQRRSAAHRRQTVNIIWLAPTLHTLVCGFSWALLDYKFMAHANVPN